MNKEIRDLVCKLCPDGVPTVRIGETGEFFRGKGIQKIDLQNSGLPAIHYGQLHTSYGFYASTTISFVEEKLWKNSRRAKYGDIILATTSENLEDLCKPLAWLGSEEVAVSGDATIFRHNMDPLFAMFYFSSDHFKSLRSKMANGTKVKRIAPARIAEVAFALPPREIQEKISNILLSFVELESKLVAEVQMRQRQFNHYRNYLMDFGIEQL